MELSKPAQFLADKLGNAQTREEFDVIREQISTLNDKAEQNELILLYFNKLQSVLPENEAVFLKRILEKPDLRSNETVIYLCDKIFGKSHFDRGVYGTALMYGKPMFFKTLEKLGLVDKYLDREEKKFYEKEALRKQNLLDVVNLYTSNPVIYQNEMLQKVMKNRSESHFDAKWASSVKNALEIYSRHPEWYNNIGVQKHLDLLFNLKKEENPEDIINFLYRCTTDDEIEFVTEPTGNAKQDLINKIERIVNSTPSFKSSYTSIAVLADIRRWLNSDLEIRFADKFFDTDLITHEYMQHEIYQLAKYIEEDNCDARIEFLDFYENNKDSFKDCSDHDMILLLSRIDNSNIEFVKTLFLREDIPSNAIARTLDWVTPNNMVLLTELFKSNDIPLKNIKDIASATTGRNGSSADNQAEIDFFKELRQNYRNISIDYLYDIISEAAPRKGNEYKTKFFRKLAANPNISDKELVNIIRSVNKFNLSFAEKICFDSSYPVDKISNTLFNLQSPMNHSNDDYSNFLKKKLVLAEKMYSDKDFPNEYIAKILGVVTEDNIEYVEAMAFDKSISLDKLVKIDANAFYVINDNNIDFVKDLLINREKYNIYEEQISDLIQAFDVIELDKIAQLNKLLSKEQVLKFDRFELLICSQNVEAIGKKSIEELSKSDKRALLETILVNKALIEKGELKNIQNILPFFPQDTEGYINCVDQLKRGLNINTDVHSAAIIYKFNNSVDNLMTSLLDVDMSNVRSIDLTYSQADFVSRISEILKDLPQDEKLHIQAMFNFKIENGKLLGYPSDCKNENLQIRSDIYNAVRDEVYNYMNNSVKTENAELNIILSNLVKSFPEIMNQIDGTNLFVNVVIQLQKALGNNEYKALSEEDKKVVVLGILLSNTDMAVNTRGDAANEAYFFAKRYGLSESSAQKLYSVVELADAPEEFMATTKKPTVRNYRGFSIEGQERQNIFDLLAFKMKEENIFNLSSIVYSTKYNAGFTRFFDKILRERIDEIKSNDFVLTQTMAETYQSLAQEQEMFCNGTLYNVKVVHASDIPNHNAFVHTPEVGYATGGTRSANFANFKLFEMLRSQKIVCTSYVSADKAPLIHLFGNGFILEVANDNQYVGFGCDIASLSKNIPEMLIEYFRDRGYSGMFPKRGKRFDHRTFISNSLKKLLYGRDKDADKKYIERLDNIKNQLGDDVLTIERLQEIDPEFANAYEKFLNSSEWKKFTKKFLNKKNYTEVLVSNPKIIAIFTDNLDKLPEEYFIKAQEENLPIVVYDVK